MRSDKWDDMADGQMCWKMFLQCMKIANHHHLRKSISYGSMSNLATTWRTFKDFNTLLFVFIILSSIYIWSFYLITTNGWKYGSNIFSIVLNVKFFSQECDNLFGVQQLLLGFHSGCAKSPIEGKNEYPAGRKNVMTWKKIEHGNKFVASKFCSPCHDGAKKQQVSFKFNHLSQLKLTPKLSSCTTTTLVVFLLPGHKHGGVTF